MDLQVPPQVAMELSEFKHKGAYLSEGSVEMQEMRLAHRAQRAVNQVPWELVLNFDQLWKSSYDPDPKVLAKRRAKEAERQGEHFGEIRPDDLAGSRLKVVATIVGDAMTARMGQCVQASKLRKTAASIGATAVTSTWGSGQMGPLGICLPSGAVPASFLREINESYIGHIYLFESGTESHFMNADTTLLYLQELVAPESWIAQ